MLTPDTLSCYSGSIKTNRAPRMARLLDDNPNLASGAAFDARALTVDGVRWTHTAAKFWAALLQEVEADYQHILERHRTYRYAPDVSAKIERSRGTARQRMEEIRQRSAREAADAKDHG